MTHHNKTEWSLDEPLLAFDAYREKVGWTIGESFEGFLAFGGIGSGKTSGPLKKVPLAMFRAGYGALVLCGKTDEAERAREMAFESGRENDVIMFGAGRKWCYNFFDDLKKGGADSIIAALREIGVAISGGQARINEWTLSAEAHMRSLLQLFELSGRSVNVFELRMATSDLDTHRLMLGEAKARVKTSEQAILLRKLFAYFTKEWLTMSDKTKQGILMSLNPQLEPFTTGDLRKLFCSTSNIRPEDMRRGKIIIVAIPILGDADVAGRAAAAIWKYMVIRQLQKFWGDGICKSDDPRNRPIMILVDEYQYVATKADALSLTTTRAARIAMVLATQSIANFLIREGRAKQETDALLPSLKTRVICQLSCHLTTQWVNEQIGKTIEERESQSANFGSGEGSGGASVSRSKEFQLGIADFSRLKCGGKENRYVVCAIFNRGDRVFKDSRGEERSWVQIAFVQTKSELELPPEGDYEDSAELQAGLSIEDMAAYDKMLKEYDKPRDFD